MKHSLLLAFFVLLFSCAPYPKIGGIVPPYPESWKHYGSGCIGDSMGFNDCEYALGMYKTPQNSIYLVIEEFQSRDAAGHAIWKIKNLLLTKRIPDKSVVITSICNINGIQDETIIATIPEHDRNSPEYIQAVGWAYKFELPSGALKEINTNMITCYNTAIDAD